MIDFTNMPRRNKTYAGANGSKISILYNDELYMLKFPAPFTRKSEMSYSSICISEYVGCKIYESIGIPVQKVLLGTYTTEAGKEKVVVACKDFAIGGLVLQDFTSLKNQIIDSERSGYGTELSDILANFDNQSAIDSKELSDRFWDMFIVDALIGNWDRHRIIRKKLSQKVNGEIPDGPYIKEAIHLNEEAFTSCLHHSNRKHEKTVEFDDL